MERELTPVEARSGVISGRIFLILVISSVAAVAALAIAWLIFSPA
jgi:hypothetical protein